MTVQTVEVQNAGPPSELRRRFSWWRTIRWMAIGLLGALILIQLYPYGRNHSNPPVTQAVQWANPRTEALFSDACADCHSNETAWPWYSNVAPVSWLVQYDVDEGRGAFNVSEPGGLEEAGEAAETVQDGSMPPWIYKVLHSDARLTDAEVNDLMNGLIATFGQEEEDDD